MNGEDGRDVTEGVGEECLDVVRHQRRVPVVTVYHVRLPACCFTQLLHQCQHAAREEDESTIIVAVAVDAASFERGRNVEQVGRDDAVGDLPHAQFFGAFADWKKRGGDGPRDTHAAVLQLAIVRHHDPYIVAGLTERVRERARDIGEASRFDQRRDFSGDKQDVHARSWKEAG